MKETKGSIETKKTILIVLISLCIVGLVVVGLLFLLGGKTTTTGTKNSNEKSETLVCSGTNINYPKLPKTDSEKEELKITSTFSDKKIDTIGLNYAIYYTNSGDVKGGEAILHAKLNIGFGELGLDISTLNNKFNQYEDRLILTLFAKKDELNEKTAPYFLLDVDSGQINNWTIEDYKNNYTGLGFSCQKS